MTALPPNLQVVVRLAFPIIFFIIILLLFFLGAKANEPDKLILRRALSK